MVALGEGILCHDPVNGFASPFPMEASPLLCKVNL